MFFRSLQKPILLVLIAQLSACSWVRNTFEDLVQDEPKSTDNYSAKELNLSCMKPLPEQLQLLFAGKYTESPEDQGEVQAIWDCLDHALSVFSTYTTGENAEFYTTRELTLFANRYLSEERPLTAKFAEAIFRLKRDVLGGSDTALTRDEISSLRKKLHWFGSIIKPLSPYFSALLSTTKDEERRTEASKRLNLFVMNLAELLADSQNDLSWSNLQAFIHELELYTLKNGTSTLTVVREQMQIYQYFKLLLVGGNEFAIEKKKWRPIFQSISHFYNALFLSQDTSEILEELSLEVQSNETEQRRSVEKITGLFRVLTQDPSISSQKSIQLLADRWAKALILNAALFPRTQGSLALKTFLDSQALRKLSGTVLEEVSQLQKTPNDLRIIQELSDHVGSLIEQAHISGADASGYIAPINFKSLSAYAESLRPLIQKPEHMTMLLTGITLLNEINTLAIGRLQDSASYKDLRALIKKLSSIYIAWLPNPETQKRDTVQAIGATIDAVLESPSPYYLKVEQFEKTIQASQNLIQALNIKLTFDWNSLLKMVTQGFKLKSHLFGNSDTTITAYELRQLQFYYTTFQKPGELHERFDGLARALRNNPFSSASVKDLVTILDSFLPKQKKLKDLGLTPTDIEYLKGILIGGNPKSIERTEYADAVQLVSIGLKRLVPLMRQLPKNFRPGINSATLGLAEAGVSTLIDGPHPKISLPILSDAVLHFSQKAELPVRKKTVDAFLLGFNHRALEGLKNKKPTEISGEISRQGLTVIAGFLSRLKKSVIDIETAFLHRKAGAIHRDELLSRLKLNETQKTVSELQPILNHRTPYPLFSSESIQNPHFSMNDLLYKQTIYHAVEILFPAYHLNKNDPNLNRLSYHDTVDILTDINDALYDFGLTLGSSPPERSAKKRLQTINLFTRTGNGDEYLDITETVEFLTIASGGKALLDETRKILVQNCKPEIDPKDFEAVLSFSYECIQKTLFDPKVFRTLYEYVAPAIVTNYESLNSTEQESFMVSALTATNAKWKTQTEMPVTDLEVLSSIPFYVENIFLRLDSNFDSTLTFSEAFAGFPVFCGEIKKASGVSGSCDPRYWGGQVESVYGYMLFYGKPPEGMENGDGWIRKLGKAFHFLKWHRRFKNMNKSKEYRDQFPPYLKRHQLLDIISNLSTSVT